MTQVAVAWPALADCASRGTLSCEYGIWGKFAGTTEDFGWIARSQSFNVTGAPVEDELILGTQDLLQSALFWRVTASRALAVAVVPSRVTDRWGRSGLEKHVLECRIGGIPVVAAALVLIKAAWNQAQASTVAETGAIQAAASATGTMTLPGEVLDTDESLIHEVAAAGVRSLIESATRDSLVRFYAAVLAGQRPAMLVVERPLEPEALAALLLPLERGIADHLSLAGWIVSSAGYERMPDVWDGIVWSRVPPEFDASVPDVYVTDSTRILDQLYGFGLPSPPAATSSERHSAQHAGTSLRTRGASTPVGRGISPSVKMLAAFAESPERWRSFPVLRAAHMTVEERALLNEAVATLRCQLDAPPILSFHLREARRLHLQAKLELVRRLAQQIDPSVGDDWTLE